MNAYELSPRARKAIARFSKDEFYVYIRPTSSKYSEPGKTEGQWWVASVQIRGVPPHEFREEGRVLDEVICALADRVPYRSELSDYGRLGRPDYIGFLAPHALWLEKYNSILEGKIPASPALKAAVEANIADLKAAKSKKGHLGPAADRRGEGRAIDSTIKGHGTEKLEKSKKSKKDKGKKNGKKK